MMKKATIALGIALFALTAAAQQPLVIERQGHFSVGGTEVRHAGRYDNSKFVGWDKQDETGQRTLVDHAFVDYQIPAAANKLPLVFVHGYGGSGVCWEMTPDGRDGFATLMLRRGYATYVMDLPGRGRAGRTSATATTKPLADNMFWFDIWRIGVWPNYNKGVQFPADSAYLSQFFREMTPDLSDHTHDVPTITAIGKRIGSNILVTHSAGGVTGWFAAMASPATTKAIVAYEPGAYVFPEGEVPDKIDGLTGGCAGIPVKKEQFAQLARIPIVMYFGDYIPETPSLGLGDENWRVRLQMGRKFVECVNRHGGHATLIELPKIGIHGNTHFLMQDLNNDTLASLLDQWLKSNGLAGAARDEMPFALGKRLPASSFHGEAYLSNIISPDTVFNFPRTNVVTFAPGAHSDWHRHGGMELLVTGGVGLYQEEGKPARILRRGDVVDIPAGTRHWHGAARGNWFQQIVVYDDKWTPAANHPDASSVVSDDYCQTLVEQEAHHPNTLGLTMFQTTDSLTRTPTFTGPVRLTQVLASGNAAGAAPIYNVVFEPGSYNAWHKHDGGQILIATDGVGYHQIKGQPLQVLRPGDVAFCPPGVYHWHGGSASARFAHLAIETNPGKSMTWTKTFFPKKKHLRLPQK